MTGLPPGRLGKLMRTDEAFWFTGCSASTCAHRASGPRRPCSARPAGHGDAAAQRAPDSAASLAVAGALATPPASGPRMATPFRGACHAPVSLALPDSSASACAPWCWARSAWSATAIAMAGA